MRRIFLALTMAAMMAVFAAPAKADVVDVNVDDLCNPFIYDVDITGCVFSDDYDFDGDDWDVDFDGDDWDIDFDDDDFDDDDVSFFGFDNDFDRDRGDNDRGGNDNNRGGDNDRGGNDNNRGGDNDSGGKGGGKGGGK